MDVPKQMIRHRIELELRSSDARIGIFTEHGEQEEKLSETGTTLAHLVLRKSLGY